MFLRHGKSWVYTKYRYLFLTVFLILGWLVEFFNFLLIIKKYGSHSFPRRVEHTQWAHRSPYRPQSLCFDSTSIHVNPGDIFKPVTNYSLPHRPVDDRGVLSLIGGLCPHLSLTLGAGRPVVPFISRVTGRPGEYCCEGRGLVFLANHHQCQVYPSSQRLVRICCKISSWQMYPAVVLLKAGPNIVDAVSC